MRELNVLNLGNIYKLLHVLNSSPLLFESFSRFKGCFFDWHCLNAPWFASLIREDHKKNLAFTLLLSFNFKDWFCPRYGLFKQNNSSRFVDFFSFIKSLYNYLLCLKRPSKFTIKFTKKLIWLHHKDLFGLLTYLFKISQSRSHSLTTTLDPI